MAIYGAERRAVCEVRSAIPQYGMGIHQILDSVCGL